MKLKILQCRFLEGDVINLVSEEDSTTTSCDKNVFLISWQLIQTLKNENNTYLLLTMYEVFFSLNSLLKCYLAICLMSMSFFFFLFLSCENCFVYRQLNPTNDCCVWLTSSSFGPSYFFLCTLRTSAHARFRMRTHSFIYLIKRFRFDVDNRQRRRGGRGGIRYSSGHRKKKTSYWSD